VADIAVTGIGAVTPLGVGANALLHIPRGEGTLAAGTRVQALLIGELVTE